MLLVLFLRSFAAVNNLVVTRSYFIIKNLIVYVLFLRSFAAVNNLVVIRSYLYLKILLFTQCKSLC